MNPIYRWLSGAVIGAIGVAIICILAYNYGAEKVRTEYEKKSAEQAAYLLKMRQEMERQTDRIVVRYVDKIRTIDREVPHYVPLPADPDVLSGHFRLFYDASAAGLQLPEAAGNTDAAPVTVKALADSIADNFASCHKNDAQLIALQAWAEMVSSHE